MTDYPPEQAPWKMRSQEEAYLFNPAFVALLITRMVADYTRKTKQPMPLALVFLLPPIVLHKQTRLDLPNSTITGLLPWLQKNKDAQINFLGRIIATRAITREGLMFAISHSCLALEGPSLVLGKHRLPANYSKSADLTEETRDCIERSSFVGRWFADVNDKNTIFAAWGVRP